VLRSLCTQVVPNTGKTETLIHNFEDWKSVKDQGLVFDWDDAAGNAARREAGLKLEKLRNAEIKRKRQSKAKTAKLMGKKTGATATTRMPVRSSRGHCRPSPGSLSLTRSLVAGARSRSLAGQKREILSSSLLSTDVLRYAIDALDRRNT